MLILFTLIFSLIGDLILVMIMYCVFSRFKESLLASTQVTMFCNSLLTKELRVSMFLCDIRIAASSAYCECTELWQFWKSLVYMLNKSGPKIDP